MTKTPLILALTFTLLSCNPSTIRNSRINVVDLASKNVEYVRSNLESVLGTDSAGHAALEFVKDYETELGDNYPNYAMYKTIPVEQPYRNDQLQYLSEQNGSPTYVPPPVPTDEINAHNSFMAFLRGKLIHSEVLLDHCYRDYISTNNLDHAKLGVAAGYVAISSNPWDVRMPQIINRMSLFLDSLYAKSENK